MKHRYKLFGAALILLVLSAGTGVWLFGANVLRRLAPGGELARGIDLAGDYLVAHCGDDGRFEYRVNLDARFDPKPQYNIVRHAGAVYALATDYQRRPSPDRREAMLRSAGFLRREAVAPVPGREGLMAVWSRPKIECTGEPIEARLGGAGLGLVALLSVEAVAPGTTPSEELQALGQFILFMQEPNGGFFAAYDPSRGGRCEPNASLYYPGEAALGLLMLHEVDPRPEWLDAAARAMGYLARLREGQTRVEPDHWALLATARLLDHYDEMAQPPVSRETILAHARQICRSILAEKAAFPADDPAHGCFTDDTRTCPTATRVEGLAAALGFLPAEDKPLRAEIGQATRDAARFLLRAQSREGRCAGGLPQMLRPLPPTHPRYRPGVHPSATEVRIDYVQHTLCAWIACEALGLLDAGDR
ncbi:MAG: hypothetical protein JW809_04995 [Pirellulales bacterium]|nr:hypothetical protein [Pirellulales bacterium]